MLSWIRYYTHTAILFIITKIDNRFEIYIHYSFMLYILKKSHKVESAKKRRDSWILNRANSILFTKNNDYGIHIIMVILYGWYKSKYSDVYINRYYMRNIWFVYCLLDSWMFLLSHRFFPIRAIRSRRRIIINI